MRRQTWNWSPVAWSKSERATPERPHVFFCNLAIANSINAFFLSGDWTRDWTHSSMWFQPSSTRCVSLRLPLLQQWSGASLPCQSSALYTNVPQISRCMLLFFQWTILFFVWSINNVFLTGAWLFPVLYVNYPAAGWFGYSPADTLRVFDIETWMSLLNDTAQPVDSEEEGRSPTMDRRWLIEKKQPEYEFQSVTERRMSISLWCNFNLCHNLGIICE